MKYFSLANLSTQKLEDLGAPYEKEWKYPTELEDVEKYDDYVKWRTNPNTRHLFFSLVEPLNPAQRLSLTGNLDQQNPIRLVWGVVLDFDCHDHDLAWGTSAIGSLPEEKRPTWIGLTYRGGFRLVWEFESPLLIPNPAVFEGFITLFCELTQIERVLPCLDKASKKPGQYYERGRSWRKCSDKSISQDLLNGILFTASEKAVWKGTLFDPPMEEIVKLVSKRFPNKWPGEFREGARGPRFWDSTADNPTAAVVRRTGMQCFTGEVPFKRWTDIFGEAEIRSIIVESTARVVKDFFYDGQCYHSYHPVTGRYRAIKRVEEFRLYIKEYYKVPKERVQEVQAKIEEEQRIDFALPLPFLASGIHTDSQGSKILNTSQLELLKAADAKNQRWGENFPLLADFLDQLFGKVDSNQLIHFLSSLSYYYRCCNDKKKSKGQVTFIAGPPGAGKSFFVNFIVGQIFSGVVAAGSYLVDQDKYNDHLFKSAIWVLDDEMGTSDPKTLSRYSNLLKQVAANHNLRYRPMYSSGGSVEWFGRLFVTLNEDYKSLEILPDMDINNRDKINLYRVGKTNVNFQGIVKAFNIEAPFFCRYLLEYSIPEELKDPRFGVKAYHEPEIVKRTDVGSRTAMDAEIFEEFRARLFERDEFNKKEYVVFTPLNIFAMVQSEAVTATQSARSHWSSAWRFHRLLFSLESELATLKSIVPEKKNGKAYFVIFSPKLRKEMYESVYQKAKDETLEKAKII